MSYLIGTVLINFLLYVLLPLSLLYWIRCFILSKQKIEKSSKLYLLKRIVYLPPIKEMSKIERRLFYSWIVASISWLLLMFAMATQYKPIDSCLDSGGRWNHEAKICEH